jgi:hypothetical protein
MDRPSPLDQRQEHALNTPKNVKINACSKPNGRHAFTLGANTHVPFNYLLTADHPPKGLSHNLGCDNITDNY